MIQTKWNADNITDQTGKNILITGANSGIGFEAARVLSNKGAHVILGVRNLQKGAEAVAAIKQLNANASVHAMQMDLCDLDSVKKFSNQFHQQYNTLHVLINNAGIMLPYKRQTTVQGFEIQFGTNHLGHFALTGLLLDLIKKTPHAVVAVQSSIMHKIKGAKIQFEDLNWEKSYNNWLAYAQSKLANLLFAYELNSRLKSSHINAIAVAAHPGYTATNLQRTSGFMMKEIGNHFIAQKVSMGALPILRAATEAGLRGGEYFGPKKFMELRGFPELVSSNNLSHNTEIAKKLWEVSEKLTGVIYQF